MAVRRNQAGTELKLDRGNEQTKTIGGESGQSAREWMDAKRDQLEKLTGRAHQQGGMWCAWKTKNRGGERKREE